jgi:dihydroorotate dehydrogenase (NAD+) catalytic subunit
MANVSGFSIEDYAYTCQMLDKEEQVGWLEVNVSCPNVHGGGMSFGTSPEAAAEVVKAVKAGLMVKTVTAHHRKCNKSRAAA